MGFVGGLIQRDRFMYVDDDLGVTRNQGRTVGRADPNNRELTTAIGKGDGKQDIDRLVGHKVFDVLRTDPTGAAVSLRVLKTGRAPAVIETGIFLG
jgi:hypothetical protein